MHDLQYDVDFFGTPGDVLAFVPKCLAGFVVGGAAGVVIVLASEAIGQFDLEEVALAGTLGLLIRSSRATS